MQNQQEDLIKGLDRIAHYTGYSRTTVRAMVDQDNLPAYKLRGQWVSSKDMLDRYFEDLKQKMAPELAAQ
mgnify:CR=1 FL=1